MTSRMLSIVCSMPFTTCPARTAARGIDIVRKRRTMPSCLSMAMTIAVDDTPLATVTMRIPGVR